VWATSSYFASRSHPNNAVSLAPVYVVALIGALRLTSGEGFQRLRTVLRAVLVPVLACVLIGAFGYLQAIPTFIQNPPAAVLSVQSDFWSDAQLSAFMRSDGIGSGAARLICWQPTIDRFTWSVSWRVPTKAVG
jgi:nitrate reductase NapE component